MKGIVPILFCWLLIGCTEPVEEPNSVSIEPQNDTIGLSVDSLTIDPMEFLEAACFEVANAFVDVNRSKLQALFHPELGAYLTYRMGVYNTFTHMNGIEDGDPFLPFDYYQLKEYPQTLQSGTNLHYDCGDKWNMDSGFWVDATTDLTPVSSIANELEQLEMMEVESEELELIRQLEEGCVKVVFTPFGEGLVFYLTWIDDNWYLSVIDNVSTSCGA